jgi:putative membrane protein
MNILSAAEHEAVAKAIHDAEAHTDGEIYAVLARRSDDYFAAAGFAVSFATIIAACLTALVLHYLWYQISAQDFALAMAAAYFCALTALWFLPGSRLWLVSRRTQYERAHLNAQSQFLSRNIHITKRRTGVLIFVSLSERYAEVVADEVIDLRVKQEEWDGIVALLIDHAKRGRLAEGYLLAIARSGEILKGHFPKSLKDTNELDDHMVEL